MSKVFDSQVAHYRNKFYYTVDNISISDIEVNAKGKGITDEALKAGLLEDSEEFRKFCYSFAKTLMPGRVSCTTYAAVVAVIAKKFEIPYKAYSGFCLRNNLSNSESEKEKFNKLKSQGNDEHPVFANHVYLVINDSFYEYFNGDTSNIDHLDCVEL